jgi:hypothetical protein
VSSWSKYQKRQKNKFLRELEEAYREIENGKNQENRENYEVFLDGDDPWMDTLDGWLDDFDAYDVGDLNYDSDSEHWDDYDYCIHDCFEFRPGDHIESPEGKFLVLERGGYANLLTGRVVYRVPDATLLWRS